tara:strand:- start:297 stop:542 length:246 start_codon:yes stop_codon:yes gene_type:complete
MKILKLIPVMLILTLCNTISYANECTDIKMNSSVNIIKKLKCKASGEYVSTAEVAEEGTAEDSPKKKGILSKLFKKPTWMK